MRYVSGCRRRARPIYSGATEPVYECGPGRETGTTDCSPVFWRRAREGISEIASVPRTAAEELDHECSASLLLWSRCAQGDCYGLCAVGWRGRPQPKGEAKVLHVYQGSAGAFGLVAGMWSHPCGDGIHRRVLEAGVARSTRPV